MCIRDRNITVFQNLHNHSLFQKSFYYLQSAELTEKAGDIIAATLNVMKNVSQCQDLFNFILNNVCSLEKNCKECLTDELMDQVEQYVRVLTKFGMKFSNELIFNLQNVAMQIIEILNTIMGNTNFDEIYRIINFWVRFVKQLKIISNKQIQQEKILQYSNQFSILINLICQKLRLSKDCLLYTSPSPRDRQKSRMPSSA
eukprot:TRINITY_DN15261_c0_g1_i1.p2 TRINITY_DN15261_c0_g1~~TRINITY_DN15261_c0_g1_i1.p2  ORF type:complete len:200 (+),score=36.48 TRINITY_DN15261_c0_g1_i1:116-715(+)